MKSSTSFNQATPDQQQQQASLGYSSLLTTGFAEPQDRYVQMLAAVSCFHLIMQIVPATHSAVVSIDGTMS